jgi:hypothetical protein
MPSAQRDDADGDYEAIIKTPELRTNSVASPGASSQWNGHGRLQVPKEPDWTIAGQRVHHYESQAIAFTVRFRRELGRMSVIGAVARLAAIAKRMLISPEDMRVFPADMQGGS